MPALPPHPAPIVARAAARAPLSLRDGKAAVARYEDRQLARGKIDKYTLKRCHHVGPFKVKCHVIERATLDGKVRVYLSGFTMATRTPDGVRISV